MATNLLRRAWPAVAVLAALASTGGTDGTCGGAGTEDPQAGACAAAAECVGLPHVACLGDWTCEAGACRWVCDMPPPTGCRTEADCEGGAHDLCMGQWVCRADGTCAWNCDTEPVDCVVDADCATADGAARAPQDVACEGTLTCQMGRCVWTCVGPPWQCTADSDCGKGQACVNGACQAVVTDCVVSGCSGEICAATSLDSTCQWLDWYKCLSLTTCGRRADGSCGWDVNAAFLQCRDGGGVACASNQDCRNDRNLCPDAATCDVACIDGVCVQQACVPTAETCNGIDDDCNGIVDDGCTVTRDCYTDADCAVGQECDHTGYAEAPGCCVPLPDGTGCPADYPLCPGVCVGIPVPCTANDECGVGQVCVAGTCTTPTPPACTPVKPGSHGACKMVVGWIFDGQQCVLEGGCTCEPDCAAVFAGQKDCEAACGSTSACTMDADCGKGEACMNGQCVRYCVPAVETCNGIDDDCNGIVDDGCEGATCAGDYDCPDGFYCAGILCGNGWCSGNCKALPACTVVKPYSHGTCEMMLGVIFDGKQCVSESGCSCGNDCAAFFADLPTCWRSCNAWPPD
jgi:eight-cysteine-cluster-containing protein